MGRMTKRRARNRQIRWMGMAIGLLILLGSCRTIDCGCPMAAETEKHEDSYVNNPTNEEGKFSLLD
jgi:hypothetical protein